MLRIPVAFLALAAATLGADAQAAPAALTVAFEGIKTETGAIMVALFDSEAAFDGSDGKPVHSAMIPATAARVETVIAGLAPGRYAIKAFHDVDGDGKLRTNPFGMPLEPFAFSNNAKGMMGPAKWSAAAFAVEAGTASHAIAID